MAPTADALPNSAVKPESILSEKAPVLVEIWPAAKETIPSPTSTSTSPLQARSVSGFQLEDHPIDVVRKLRVRITSIRNPQTVF